MYKNLKRIPTVETYLAITRVPSNTPVSLSIRKNDKPIAHFDNIHDLDDIEILESKVIKATIYTVDDRIKMSIYID